MILSLFCRDKIIFKMCPQLFRISSDKPKVFKDIFESTLHGKPGNILAVEEALACGSQSQGSGHPRGADRDGEAGSRGPWAARDTSGPVAAGPGQGPR